jgi:hypothetical protein
MDTGNSTNSTIPKQCVGTVGSLPNLPYAMSCGTAAFGTVNDSHTESQFERCCGGNPIQLFGETAVGHTDCWVCRPYLITNPLSFCLIRYANANPPSLTVVLQLDQPIPRIRNLRLPETRQHIILWVRRELFCYSRGSAGHKNCRRLGPSGGARAASIGGISGCIGV